MAEIVDEDATQAGDELFSAATEAGDMMVWVLGGFDRQLSDEERRDNILSKYHAVLCERAARLIREGVVSEPPYEQEPGPEDAYGPA